jgi:endonuclease YncB( thermonuclease family)
VVTNQGQLIIATDDPDVEVIVKHNGEQVRVIDRKTGHEITLRAGHYTLELANGKEGLKLSATEFTLERGGKQIARVRFEPAAPEPKKEAGPPFAVLARAGNVERTFATLAEAVSAAASGDTIEVRGDASITKPVRIAGKVLTIRAAPRTVPTLALKRNSAADAAVNLWTDSPLTLEGLSFHAIDAAPADVPYYILLYSQKAPIRVAGCRFVMDLPRGQCVLAADGSPRCECRNCQAILSSEPSAFVNYAYPSNGRVILSNNVVAGPSSAHALVLAPVGNATEAACELVRNSVAMTAVAFVLGEGASALAVGKSGGSVRVDARENVLAGTALAFGQDQNEPTRTAAEAEALLKRLLGWYEERNSYAERPFLFLARRGKPIAGLNERRKLAEWEELWGSRNTGSLQGPIVFDGGDLMTKAQASPATLVPADFRLARGSSGSRPGAGGERLGAEIEIVGPGAGYEKWKGTPEYQQWLKDTARTHAVATNPVPFVILAQNGKAERRFATLREAIAGAVSGDTIEVRGNGPHLVPPVTFDKALRIRAGASCRPVLEFDGRPPTNASFLIAHAPLVLEGLEFHRDDRAPATGHTWLIEGGGTSLDVVNCSFVCWSKDRCATPLLSYARRFTVRNCQFSQSPWGYEASWVPPKGGRAVLENNVLGQGRKGWEVALEFHYRHSGGVAPRDVSVRFAHNTCNGYPVFFYLDGEPEPGARTGLPADRPIRIAMTENILDLAEGMLAFIQCQAMYPPRTARPLPVPEAKTLLRQMLDWQEERNALPAARHRFVRAYVQNLNVPLEHQGDWFDCLPPDIDPVRGPVRYAAGDIRSKLSAAPETVTPDDYRLLPDSAGYRAGKDKRDLGADVDLVGPGPAYERWKKTAEYRRWHKDT